MAKIKPKATPFPSKDEVLTFIRESPVPVGKREIARAFHIKGSDRIPLKAMLKELEREGHLELREKKKVMLPGHLPSVLVIEVADIDEDGEQLARPATWEQETPPPRIFLAPDKRSRAAFATGERILARMSRNDDGSYDAQIIRRIGKSPDRILGVYRIGREGGHLHPTDRRAKNDFVVRAEDARGAENNELVVATLKPTRHRNSQREARVLERIGAIDTPRSLSLIALYEHEVPIAFSHDAEEAAKAAKAADLGAREDLRALPLVTIDGSDARDFDDAVWAEADDDKQNPGGWHLMVAIADVAHYVTAGDALDRDAYRRGNSTYLPNQVVPMLPEELSNGWCSLKPGVDRPCLAVHMWIDAEGKPLRHRFIRGLMRSAARLTYEQVQAAHNGEDTEIPGQLTDLVIKPLYGAYSALLAAREARGTLELELTERRVVVDDDGRITAIVPRERLDSHKLIEEFMIAANVAAASELERLRRPCMYRVHEQPDPVKIEALAQVLASMDLHLARGQVIRPKVLTQLLTKAAKRPEKPMINEMILRTQSQAVYSPENIGHFGLALPRYAHFTSPIRRYADLLVHRALISGLKLGDDGLPPDAAEAFEEIAQHISKTERRSSAAERDAVDRLTAAYMADKVGGIFQGRVNGVTRFGLFVTLDDSGADGLVPMSSLPDDRYDHNEAKHCLIGRRWGRVYSLGDRVAARLMEATPVTGGLVLQIIEGDEDAEAPANSEPQGTDASWDPLKKTSANKKLADRKSRKPGKRPTGKGKNRKKTPGTKGSRRR
ncbi:ribonuclease R [Denitrobaculum tricleocarpae]|uniref:Ribonuclease R n=1 Tax=Denitrobaculum tricleocarpae TaxID=2591009 RepID=A0A545TTV7_9PROT|nr:ribonuclease R [Denitrobaculum tricleocarpae]TQV80644.1 ribonuclease R [Denitrobaculum tricleocarpae]